VAKYVRPRDGTISMRLAIPVNIPRLALKVVEYQPVWFWWRFVFNHLHITPLFHIMNAAALFAKCMPTLMCSVPLFCAVYNAAQLAALVQLAYTIGKVFVVAALVEEDFVAPTTLFLKPVGGFCTGKGEPHSATVPTLGFATPSMVLCVVIWALAIHTIGLGLVKEGVEVADAGEVVAGMEYGQLIGSGIGSFVYGLVGSISAKHTQTILLGIELIIELLDERQVLAHTVLLQPSIKLGGKHALQLVEQPIHHVFPLLY
jgi:hypothetical protein